MLVLVDVDTGAVRELSAPTGPGVWAGALAWAAPGSIVCVQPESVVAQQTGTSSRVVLWDLASARMRPLLASPINIVAVDVVGPRRLVVETRSLRQNLRE